MNSKVWFITGCSTGFGRQLAGAALKAGRRVAVTARDTHDIEDLIHIYPDTALGLRMDVTDQGDIQIAINRAHATFGQIDVLVNCAGFGIRGSFEETPDIWMRREFETNFFGLLEVTREMIPIMRMQGSGKIFNFSSVAGQIGMAGMGVYSATKFAIEGFSEALRDELEPFGISVTLIEPGPYDTDFGHRSNIQAEPLPQYEALHSREIRSERIFGDLGLAVDCILTLADMTAPPLRLPIGPGAFPQITNKLKKDIQSYEEVKALWETTNFPEVTPQVRTSRGKKTHSAGPNGVRKPLTLVHPRQPWF